jgi:hypothetical protein
MRGLGQEQAAQTEQQAGHGTQRQHPPPVARRGEHEVHEIGDQDPNHQSQGEDRDQLPAAVARRGFGQIEAAGKGGRPEGRADHEPPDEQPRLALGERGAERACHGDEPAQHQGGAAPEAIDQHPAGCGAEHGADESHADEQLIRYRAEIEVGSYEQDRARDDREVVTVEDAGEGDDPGDKEDEARNPR